MLRQRARAHVCFIIIIKDLQVLLHFKRDQIDDDRTIFNASLFFI